MEFLSYKNNAGRPSLLSDEDKVELKELMLNTDYLTTEKLHELILARFEIDYSYKQVRIIAHKLGFSYVKPYPEYDKTPPDAELQSKKNTKGITSDDFIIGFMDQTSAQNLPNSARVLVNTENKSKIIKNPIKYRVNTVGFQAINGNSLLKFIDNSKIVSMIQYMADIRIVNMENQTIKELLYKTVYNSNLDEKCIIQQIIDKEKISDEEFKERINKRINNQKLTEKQLIHGIELDINKIKPKSDEIKHKTEDQILDNLEKSGVEEWLNKEKPIAMVLDNYTTHQSKKFQRACEIMNITLIYLPYYSPHLNPIEQTWKSIKRIVSTNYIEDMEHLKLIFQIEFYNFAKKESFFKNWLDKYIINN